MLRLCIKRSKQKEIPLKVIFAGESKTKLKRAFVAPDYKGNRTANEDPKFREFRVGLAELLKFLGWDLLCVDGAEADDVIASIVAQYCHRCKCKVPCENCDCHLKYRTDVVIFSGDRDLQQCLAWDRTFIYRSPGLFITKADFEEEHGFPIGKYGVYKALIGDKSDNIKGVEGFGPVKATMAIKAGSVSEDIYEMSGAKGVDEFRLALSLVNLDTKIEIDLDSLYLGVPIFDEKVIKKKYNDKVLLEVQRLKEEF
jgi:DNA polymerase-1